EDFLIEEALKYLMVAISTLDDPHTHLIAGRIFLRLKDLTKAKFHLERAYFTGDESLKKRCIPYLSEVYFLSKEFQKVKEILSELPFSIHPTVHFIKRVWM
ncbi:MAG: hypothetical protein ABGX27_06305, partial [Desulfurobacteriaceae bacterium]